MTYGWVNNEKYDMFIILGKLLLNLGKVGGGFVNMASAFLLFNRCKQLSGVVFDSLSTLHNSKNTMWLLFSFNRHDKYVWVKLEEQSASQHVLTMRINKINKNACLDFKQCFGTLTWWQMWDCTALLRL